MKFIMISILAAMLILQGCKQEKTEDTRTFFKSMNRLLDRAEVPLEQLSDSVVAIHSALRTDNNYIADTVAIKSLFEAAVTANKIATDSLAQLTDPDAGSGLKETALIYARDWGEVLNVEFRQWMTALSQPIENKADYFTALLSDRLKRSAKLSENLETKSRFFKKNNGF